MIIMHEGEPKELVGMESRKKMLMMERRRSSSMREQSSATTTRARLEAVDMSGRNLESLVPIIPRLNLGIIYKLDLSNNNLQMVPESLIARMLNLAVLDLHSNQLGALPNSIGCLSKLKVLNVAGNNLELLPKTIENCKSLEELNVNFNQLVKLPDTIGFELVNLEKLIVGSNKLVRLPQSTGHLTSLRHLDVSLNWLQSLPEDLENLTNLQVLNVSQNFHHLTSLPYSIGLLLSLVEFDASYNNITVLPDSMGCLGKLRRLRLEGNPLVSPPVDVIGQGIEEVKLYLSEKMNNGHISPRDKPKKKTWIGKLVRYGTFNSRHATAHKLYDQEGKGSTGLEGCRSLNYISSRNMAVFSPWRIFSPKHHSAK